MIESWGRGIERIVQACRAAHMPPPALRQDATGLWIEFTRAPAAESTPQVTPHVTPDVTPEVRLPQLLQREAMSRPAMQTAMGLKDAEHFRKTYLQPALERGFIAMTLPDTPKSRQQKYRITATGRKNLSKILAQRDA